MVGARRLIGIAHFKVASSDVLAHQSMLGRQFREYVKRVKF